MSENKDSDRLPLRWAFIIVVAVGAGVAAGQVGGPVAGWAGALATVALLYQVVGG